MELKTAIEIFEYHLEWRLGLQENMKYSARELSQSFNIILERAKSGYTIEDVERCVENWGLCKVEREYIELFLERDNHN